MDSDPLDEILNAREEKGNTPLMLACMNGHLRTVQVLLAFRPDLEVINLEGHTAYQLAIINNHAEIAGLLVTAGARARTHK